MRGFRNPIGPIHPSFYWRRRALVLAVVLVLLIVGFAVKQLWASGDSADQDKSSASATVASSGSAANLNATSSPDSATAHAASAGSASAAASQIGLPTAANATSSSSPAMVPKCDNAKVKVSIKANSLVRINTDLVVNLALTNATPDVCQVDFVATPFELKVYSGSDRIWSTNDFPALAPSGKLTLEPGKPYTFNITWPTRRSVAKGKLSADELKSGTYIATASLAGAADAKQVMRLYHK